LRRKLVACAAVVTMIGAVAALRWNHLAEVSAASGTGNLVLVIPQSTGGCPLNNGYTFCDMVVGSATPPFVFTIQASATVSGLSVSFAPIPGLTSNFNSADFTITSNSCTGSLNANQQCQVGVEFSPRETGLRQAALTVTDSAGDMLAINLAGTGKNLALEPPGDSCPLPDNAWTYCTTPVGANSGPATFTVIAGTAVTGINVSLAATPGLTSEFASGDFTISSNGCGALGAGGSCAVNVEFTPTAAGLRAATLTATDAQGDSTSIYLAGSTTTGVSFEIIEPGPNTMTCARVNFFGFCNEPQGGVSATNTFTIVNGSGTQVTGLTITPAIPTNPPQQPPPPPSDFSPLSTTCTPTLSGTAPNNTCTISVAFTPQGTGLRQGAVTVTDAQGDVASIDLAGVGDDYSIPLASSQPMEVTVAQGGKATFMLQVVPDNVFGANGEMVQFACPTIMPDFTTCSFNPCPVSVTPGMSVPFNVVIVTSTQTVPAPPVTNPCMASASNARANRQPRLATMYVTVKTPGARGGPGGARFPALMLIGIALGIVLFGASAIYALHRVVRRTPSVVAGHGMPCPDEKRLQSHARLKLIFAGAGLAALIFVGCHHTSTAPSTATPVGVYPLTITGNALDANGNPLNASRPSATFTLDVIQQK